MFTVSALKQDMEFNRDFGNIIEVLKASAIMQFRSLQLKQKPNKEFLDEIEFCFDILFGKKINHFYLTERLDLPSLIVAVTSDTGFLGELNTVLVNAATDERKSGQDEIIVIGEQGARYLEDMNLSFTALPGLSDEVGYSQLQGIRDYLFNGYKDRFGRVLVVYSEFLSLTTQKIKVFQFLPCKLPSLQENKISIIMESAILGPSEIKLLEKLIELWAGFKVLDIAWSSKQSEYAARIMHLEGSSQELAHINERVAFDYFRLVHTLRDKSIREISAAKLLLEK